VRQKLMLILLIGAVFLLNAMPVLAQKVYTTLEEYEKVTGKSVEEFNETPILRVKVAAGELPPVEKRLPVSTDVFVIEPEDIGQYGGSWRETHVGREGLHSTRTCEPLINFSPDWESLHPNVIKAWKWNEDATEVTFSLRKGMKWSDGYPVTADDFLLV